MLGESEGEEIPDERTRSELRGKTFEYLRAAFQEIRHRRDAGEDSGGRLHLSLLDLRGTKEFRMFQEPVAMALLEDSERRAWTEFWRQVDAFDLQGR